MYVNVGEHLIAHRDKLKFVPTHDKVDIPTNNQHHSYKSTHYGTYLD